MVGISYKAVAAAGNKQICQAINAAMQSRQSFWHNNRI
jgi:hypothetical protein